MPCGFSRGAIRRLPLLIVALVPLFGSAGCTAPAAKDPVYPVKGQLFYNDKPATGAVVWFHPTYDMGEISAQNPASEPRPSGIVDEQGNFEMSTYGFKDGAPPGRYRVSVMWTKSKGGDAEENLLPLHFMDPRKSTLPVIEVKAESENILVPFRISGERN